MLTRRVNRVNRQAAQTARDHSLNGHTPNVESCIKQGWSLVECAANEKHPIDEGWPSAPSLTLEEALNSLDQGKNIGVRVGLRSYIIDIEADGPEGKKGIQKLFDGRIPPTPTFQSRRGEHRLFRYDPTLEKIDKAEFHAGSVGFLLGCNGKGCQSLLPPSTADGHTRAWLPGLSPAEVEPAKLPPEVKKKIIDAAKTTTPTDGKPADGDVIPEGERNDTLTSLAGAMRRQGASEAVMMAALVERNNDCVPPLSDKELRGIVKSVGKYEPDPKDQDEAEADDDGLFPVVEPWEREVNGARLLHDLERFLTRYVVLPPGAALVVSTWCMAAWAIDAFDRFAHLAVTSPEKRCGKTRLLETLAMICPRPLPTSNIKPAPLYRIIERSHPTILIDEAQSLGRYGSETSDTLRELLNAGIVRGAARVLRCVGSDYDVMPFDVFGPKVVAAIGELDSVLADRCLAVRMERKTAADAIQQFRTRLAEQEAAPLARKVCRWATDNAKRLGQVYDKIDSFNSLTNDRLAELLLPLMAVVKVCDPKRLPELKRYAAGLDDAEVEVGTQPPGVRLLAALREVFGQSGAEFMPTLDILKSLKSRKEEAWATWGHRLTGMTQEALAFLLRQYKVKPCHSRDKKLRGYYRKDLEGVWRRYLPPALPHAGKTRPSRPTRPCRAKAKRCKKAKSTRGNGGKR